MSILKELNTIIETTGIPVETGVFKGKSPNEYVVLTPLTESFSLYGDNKPLFETQEVRLSLFCKGNYIKIKNQLVALLLQADFTITERRFIGLENDTGYYNYAIDVIKEYETEV